MLDRINIFPIIRDRFCRFHFEEGRKFSACHLLLFAILPVAGGMALAFLLGSIPDEAVGLWIAILSIVAVVVTSLLAVVHSLIGMTNLDREFQAGQWELYRHEVCRLEVLRELYADLCFDVILLVSSLGLLLATKLTQDVPYVSLVLSGMVYAISVQVALSFLHIITNV